MGAHPAARTYNQSHIPRPHTGGRRISIYWTWSYPWEAQRDPAAMYNRFSTMTEVRNALWPSYETPEYDEAHFLQGIAGTLELFHRSTLAFQELAGEATGHPVAVFQRIDQAGYKLPVDERILADTDTLMVFGLDHILSEQEAAPEEISAIREWLRREGTCLLLAPHHDVGFTDDFAQRQVEYQHHGDPLVPRQQRLGQYTRSLMKAFDVPVHNTWGLRPAVVEGTKEIAPLAAFSDLDAARLLDNVTTFNFHPPLPHYELTAPESDSVRVLGRQRIDPNRPHPFTAAGNTEFNQMVRRPQLGRENFCANLAPMRWLPSASAKRRFQLPTLCSAAPAASRSTVNTNLSSADRPGQCLVKLGRSAGLPRPDHVPRSIASKAPRDC